MIAFYTISPVFISYGILWDGMKGEALDAELFDCLGKRLLSYQVKDYAPGAPIAIKGCNLKNGIRIFFPGRVIPCRRALPRPHK